MSRLNSGMQSDLTQNHFELFGLAVGFEVDTHVLSERYRDLQRTVHPDRFANAADQERRLSVQRAAQINEAFQTLKQPLPRARYLLGLLGVDMNDETDTNVDPEFLMEQITLRESLAEVREKADPLEALQKIAKDIHKRIRALVEQLTAAFQTGSQESLLQARDTVRKLQFLYRLQQEADALDEELFDTL